MLRKWLCCTFKCFLMLMSCEAAAMRLSVLHPSCTKLTQLSLHKHRPSPKSPCFSVTYRRTPFPHRSFPWRHNIRSVCMSQDLASSPRRSVFAKATSLPQSTYLYPYFCQKTHYCPGVIPIAAPVSPPPTLLAVRPTPFLSQPVWAPPPFPAGRQFVCGGHGALGRLVL